jgi:hypothetical protein
MGPSRNSLSFVVTDQLQMGIEPCVDVVCPSTINAKSMIAAYQIWRTGRVRVRPLYHDLITKRRPIYRPADLT